MKRDLFIAGALWLLLTIIGEILAIAVDIYPVARSDKGEEIEKAFRILVIFAVPVFTFVVAVLLYSVFRHRARDDFPSEDGPGYQGRGAVPLAWFGITAGLTVVIMIYPGLTSLPGIVGDDPPELVVEVRGFQWQWQFTYPEQNINIFGTRDNIPEMVLPVDRTVRFEITSADVLHSFWVPAFLMKIDAVPGQTTIVTLQPTKIGSYQTDILLRVQCTELCGMEHGRMMARVAVVSDEDFHEWVAAQQEALTGGGEEPTPVSGAQEFTIVGENIQFDIDEIQAEADGQVAITFDNRDQAVPHNLAVYESEEAANSGANAIAGSPIEAGPSTQTIVFDAPAPGTYFFRCDVHPTTMTGTLEVN